MAVPLQTPPLPGLLAAQQRVAEGRLAVAIEPSLPGEEACADIADALLLATTELLAAAGSVAKPMNNTGDNERGLTEAV
jgi:hypothetical protein